MPDSLYIVAINLGGYTVPALLAYSEDESPPQEDGGSAVQGSRRGTRATGKRAARTRSKGECTLASLLK